MSPAVESGDDHITSIDINSPLIEEHDYLQAQQMPEYTAAPSSPSSKKRVLSLYAGKNMKSFDCTDEKNNGSGLDGKLNMTTRMSQTKDESPRMPLSTKYANLIKRARREISKDAFDIANHFSRSLK